ncbi:MAG: hypothetical protein NDF54_04265 [archaeon GB-1867-035]|nr:hypothetical protein [Candidatus Culexmicrobium profundum]
MNRRKVDYLVKVKRAAQLLLLQRHLKPGVKGWELKRALGRKYLDVIKILDEELAKFGLKVKIVFRDDVDLNNVSREDYDRALFVVTLREPTKTTDILTVGWRIDDVGALAAALAYVNSRGGFTRRRELEDLLAEKLPRWRVDSLIDKFIRYGYLREDGGVIKIGWRAKAEIDFNMLSMLLLTSPTEASGEK